MENIQEFIPPRPLLPEEPLEKAVYCGECENFKQDVIGTKNGTCMSHFVKDSNIPMACKYYKNAQSIVSIFVFLKSGISIYHKAIVKDFTKEMDPSLLTSFLQAINTFGQELTNEQISLIQFQNINILFCRGKYTNGALIVRGKIMKESKDMFSFFLNRLEESFPNYFNGNYTGRCLPEEKVDYIALKAMKEYAKEKFYTISPSILENICKFECGTTSKCA